MWDWGGFSSNIFADFVITEHEPRISTATDPCFMCTKYSLSEKTQVALPTVFTSVVDA